MSESQVNQSQGAGPGTTVPLTVFEAMFGALADSLQSSSSSKAKAAGLMAGSLGAAFGGMAAVAQEPTYESAAKFAAGALTAIAVGTAVPLSAVAAAALAAAAGAGMAPLAAGLLAAAATAAAAYAAAAAGEALYDGLRDLFDGAGKLISPLALDLDGDGIEVTALGETSAYFDLDADGFAELTGWISGDDGILAWDANGNGQIDDINEVFGNDVANGFSELAAFDTDGNGIIDANDAQFSDLLVWQDLDQDGFASEDELKSLAELGIISLDLNSTPSGEMINGNLISDVSTFTWSDGSTDALVDVWFANDQMNTVFRASDVDIDPRAVLLPSLKGYGELPPLLFAMSMDETLLDQVESFSSLDVFAGVDLRGEIETILYRWAAVDNVESGSRGYYVDAQHLAFMEAFFGTGFSQFGNPNPRPNAGAALESIWDQLYGELAARVLIQGPLEGAFQGVSFDPYNDRFFLEEGVNGESVILSAITALGGTAPTDPLEAARHWDLLISTIDIVGREAGFSVGAFDAQLEQVFADAGYVFTPGALRDGSVSIGIDDVTVIVGGSGDDTYNFGIGSGEVVIKETGTGTDSLQFGAGIAPADVEFYRSNTDANDLVFVIAGTSDKVTFIGQFDAGSYGVEEVRFADGSIWTIADIQQWLLTSTAGDDDLFGYSSNDTLDGGLGDDYLEGRGGSDTYIYNSGDGRDWINDANFSGNDVIEFGPGILPSDIEVYRDGPGNNDVVLRFSGAGDELVLQQQFLGDHRGVEELRFADGTVWTKDDLKQQYLDQTITDGDDAVYGFSTGDTIDSAAGNDTINAGWGNDQITGGAGDDVLAGGNNNDTYFYTRGDGNDSITEGDNRYSNSSPGGTEDKLVLQDIDPAAVSLLRDGNNVTLVIAESAPGAGDGGSILLVNNLDEYYSQGIDQILFDDGTVWTRADLRLALLAQAPTAGDDVIDGFNTADVITGGAGNDTINAGWGNDLITGGAGDDVLAGGNNNDTYFYTRGDGNDSITEGDNRYSNSSPGGTEDKLVLQDIDPAAVSLLRDGNNVTLVIAESAPGAGDGGSILLVNNLDEYYNQGIDQILFDDGTVWTRADLRVALLAQAPTAGDDVIDGFNTADVITGGAGNDTINAGWGNDLIAGGAGDDVLAGSDGNDTVEGGAGNDVIFGGNGDDQLIGGDGDDVLRGDAGVDSFDGGAGNDTIDYSTSSGALLIDLATGDVNGIENFLSIENVIAGSGNDTLLGNDGANYLAGGNGDDSLVGGDGNDTFNGGGGVDSFVGGAGIDTADYRESASDFVADLDSDTLTTSGGAVELLVEIENVLGSTGDNMLYGDATGNRLDGYLGDDTLAGRGGDDSLLGGAGSDDFLYDIGDGNDLITEVAGDSTGDRLVFGAGILQGNVSYHLSPDQSELLVSLSDGAVITLQQQFAGDEAGIDSLHFVDGSSRSTLDIYDELTNVAPVVDQGIADTVVDEDSLLNLVIAANTFSDANLRNTLTYTAQLVSGMALPAWLLFDGTAFAGTPENGDVGALEIEVTATDDFGQSVTTQFTLTVANTNDAPTLGDSLSIAEVEVGGSLAAAIPGTAFADVDVGDQLTLTATLVDGSPLPAWLQFDGSTFTGMPGDSDVGFVAVTIQATDLAGESVSQNMQINVLPSGGVALVLGTAGDDDLAGTVADELIVGGLGDDTLSGAGGNDVYLYNNGDGADLLQNTEGRGTYDLDVLRFGEGIAVADVSLIQSGDDLLVSLAGGGQVFVEDYYHRGQLAGIEWFDGTTLSYAEVLAQTLGGTAGDDSLVGDGAHDVMAGGAGNDTIKSSTGFDVLIGGAGNDYMEGWWDGDTYVYNLGDGDDTIYEYSSSTQYSRHLGDKLVLGAGIAPGDIIVTRNAADWEDVTISFQGAAGSILLNEQFGDNRYGVEEIVFADGTVWTQSQLAHIGYAQAMTAGDDYIFGIHENDTINGAEGNDSLYGWLGADSLTGGAGDDYLEGSWHADTYVYNLGDGNDTIYEYSSSTQYSRHLGDKLVLGPGIAVGDVIVTRNAADW
ncbi:calcium-binding protein, partial [Pelagibius litoralis]